MMPVGFCQAQPNPALPANTVCTEARHLALQTLVRQIEIENQAFMNGRPSDTRFAFELFRRALSEQNDMAWEYLYQQYVPLVAHWIRRSNSFDLCNESIEFFANETFARFSRTITPTKFAQFEVLATLLTYLRQCARCVVIDWARAQREADGGTPAAQTPPDEQAIGQLQRREFWHSIAALLSNEAERAVVMLSYIYDLKPSVIAQQRPDLFATVQAVYITKRNLLERLSRNVELQTLL